MCIDGAACQKATLNEMVRIMAQDFSILAGAGFGFVGIDQQIVWPVMVFGWHERPFEAGRETAAATPLQSGRLDLAGYPTAARIDEFAGSHPGAALACALERPVVLAIEVGEDAALVGEHIGSPYSMVGWRVCPVPSADDLDEPGDCLAVAGLFEQSDFGPPGRRTNDQDR